MTPLWTHEALEQATGGQASAAFACTGLSIDTRSLKPGDLFIALSAARDGHDFVADAFARGAAAAMVAHVPAGVSGPCLVVSDVMAALGAMGAAGRARGQARVIAVTGSAGKTSTKEMLREMLAEFGTVHAAEASFNNHWGVPLTLARLPQDADFAVVEIGMNHRGEIAPLARLTRPDIALITTVAPAHLEALGSIQAIAEEKADIFQGLAPDGVAIYPADLAVTPILAAAAGARGVSFGREGQVRLTALRPAGTSIVVCAEIAGEILHLRLRDAGTHFAMNAVGCLAVARALGLDLALAAQALGRWSPPAGRGRRETIRPDPGADAGFTLIDDAFNANPASVSAALDVLAASVPSPGARRIAVLGDMLELGPDETALHRAIADHPALAQVAQVHCVGPRMAALWAALPQARRGKQVAKVEDLLPRARYLVHPGDVILVKGSKGSQVSRLVQALRALDCGPNDDERE